MLPIADKIAALLSFYGRFRRKPASPQRLLPKAAATCIGILRLAAGQALPPSAWGSILDAELSNDPLGTITCCVSAHSS